MERLLKLKKGVPVGIARIELAPTLTAPNFVNILPTWLVLAPNDTAPAPPPPPTIVPFIVVPAPVDMAALLTQNMFSGFAFPVNTTVAPATEVNAPGPLIINKDFGSPPPSNVSIPEIDCAPPMS